MWGHSSAYSSPQRLSSGLCELQYIGVFGEAVVCSETANYLVILTTAGLIRAPNYLLEKKNNGLPELVVTARSRGVSESLGVQSCQAPGRVGFRKHNDLRRTACQGIIRELRSPP